MPHFSSPLAETASTTGLDTCMETDIDTIEVQMATVFTGLPSEDRVVGWAHAVCARLGTLGQGVCIRVADEAESQALNRDYRGKNKPTNVLSFPAEVDVPEVQLLGDIVICAPVVIVEAAAQNKALHDHFAHMVVHGMCHLHGYDHEQEEEATVMESLEIELLAGFGIADPYQ